MPNTADQEFAPAKMNLALHLTGKRPDGYHELDSVVTFLNVGDQLEVEASDTMAFHCAGAFGFRVADPANSVLMAVQLMQQASGTNRNVKISLHKHLPLGTGLGGGSTDAAAAMRLLNRFWNLGFSLPQLAELGLHLGADVPSCIYSHPLRMQGIGEQISFIEKFPALHGVIVFPGSPVSTSAAFAAVTPEDFSGSLTGVDPQQWIPSLAKQKNDLQRPSQQINADIAKVLQVLSQQSGCKLARMSGSGSACFGIFSDENAANRVAAAFAKEHALWWVKPFISYPSQS